MKTASISGMNVMRRRPSAVSQVLRAWQDEAPAAPPLWRIRCESTSMSVHVASDRSLRERAYRLAHLIYRTRGYVPEGESGLGVSRFDRQADVLTLLVRHIGEFDVGTITLVPDSQASLPCDEIYGPEVDILRAQGCRLAEVTRLAISEECLNAREVLLYLFNLLYIYARRVNNCTDLVVEVNPRHAAYYKRLLMFEQIGPERPCPRVQDAPAVLMRLNMASIEAAIKGTGCVSGRDTSGARLHRYPISHEEEAQILRNLLRQQRPMSLEDAHYFRIA